MGPLVVWFHIPSRGICGDNRIPPEGIPARVDQVDVFSSQPFRGNPVAVILEAQGIGDEDMARIARWTNLSETTFVLPPTAPEADYRLRIFTPSGELPFAGHPTLGSARAWLATGGTPRRAGTIVQECAAGLVELRHDGEALAFAAPPTTRTGLLDEDEFAALIRALGVSRDRVLDHQWVDNGPGWCGLLLASAQDVLDLEPDFSAVPDAKVGLIGAYPAGASAQFEVRAFVPGVGVAEDPVTGSLNASLAQWLIRTGQAPEHYTAAQGTRLGRAGRISIDREGDDIWVGGATSVVFQGTATA